MCLSILILLPILIIQIKFTCFKMLKFVVKSGFQMNSKFQNTHTPVCCYCIATFHSRTAFDMPSAVLGLIKFSSFLEPLRGGALKLCLKVMFKKTSLNENIIFQRIKIRLNTSKSKARNPQIRQFLCKNIVLLSSISHLSFQDKFVYHCVACALEPYLQLLAELQGEVCHHGQGDR